jgi:hypothetical protein
MTTVQIIAAETFGANNEYRLDVLATRFGDYEFFVVMDDEVIRQSSDIVQATDGLHDVVGVGEAVENAAKLVLRGGS